MKAIKRPVVIDAEQFLGPTKPLPFTEEGLVLVPGYCDCGRNCQLCRAYWLRTPSGPVILQSGDWVGRQEIDGGLDVWAIKSYVFDQTYTTFDDSKMSPEFVLVELRDLVKIGIEQGWSHEDLERAQQLVPEATLPTGTEAETDRAQKVRTGKRQSGKGMPRKSG